jgi:hypothetical protein
MLGGLVGGDGDRIEALAGQVVAPVVAQQLAEGGQVVLLDQEVRPGASTLAGLASAGRAADEGGDAGLQAAIAQRLHLGDRAGDRRHDGKAVEHFVRLGCGQRLHGVTLRQTFGDSNR